MDQQGIHAALLEITLEVCPTSNLLTKALAVVLENVRSLLAPILLGQAPEPRVRGAQAEAGHQHLGIDNAGFEQDQFVPRNAVLGTAPLAAGMVFQTLYFLADLYFVGRLGKEAVAGVGLAGNLMFIVLAIESHHEEEGHVAEEAIDAIDGKEPSGLQPAH